MIFSKLVNSDEKEQTDISVNEAHNLWRLLLNRYIIIDQLNVLENFTHDKDFRYILTRHINAYRTEADKLVKELNKYSIAGPIPNARKQNTTGNSQATADRISAETLYSFIKTDITLLLYTLRETNTNDHIRNFFINLANYSFNRLDDIVKYMKLKGWIEYPPLYPYIKSDTNGKIASNEIFLLWEHLIFRYNNIRLTEVFYSFAFDPDFKTLLNRGVKILSQQVTELENKLIRYGIPLPTRYSEVIPSPESTQLLEDRFMFNTILTSMQDAAALHGSAVQEIIVNDDIRKFFRDLTFKELSIISNIIKYGKIKGWVNFTPGYKMGT